jgi:PAS domain S-box-containing protein
MLFFPGLLFFSVMLMDRVSYIATSAIILIATAALGIAEMHGLTRAIPGVRTPTSYESVFYVDLILLVFAIVGSRLARDAHSNVSDLRSLISRLSSTNLELTESAKALRDSEAKYRRLYECITDAVVAVDTTGRIIETNPAYESMLGYSAEELRRTSYQDLTPDRWHDFEARIVAEQILTNGHSKVYEKEYKRRDGTVFPVELRAFLQRDETGQPIGVLAIVRDITERKRAEAAIRESEERFRRVFEEGPLGLALVGMDYRFVKVNSALCQMLGYAESLLVQKSFAEITHPDDVAADVELAERLFKREIPFYRMQKRYLKGNGEIIWINLTASTILGLDGEPLYGLAMIEDITEIKRTHEEALFRQKLESLGTLAGGIAHDFNNLLGAVQTQAELALVELAAGSSCQQELNAIRDVTIRGSEIVRQLMIYAGTESATAEPVDLSKTVDEMLSLLKVSVTKHAVIKTNLHRDLPPINASAAQLRQIVMNLIMNASDAIGDRDGMIWVTTRRVDVKGISAANSSGTLPEGNYVQLEVSDTGCGISPEMQAKVFDPFFTTKSAGRGLGLAVVQGIVRNLSGAIDLKSEPDKSTTFRVLLPCAEIRTDASGRTMSGTSELVVPAQQDGTVLVVEDEHHLCQAVVKMLRKKGFEVFEAADGSSAINLLHAAGDKIDVILLDMTIPGASSREVVAVAANSSPKATVILTSAYSQEMIAGAMSQPQIRSFIRKPYQFGDLLKIVRNCLSS